MRDIWVGIMFKDEKIRKCVYNTLIEYFRDGIDCYITIIEAVSDRIWEYYNLIIAQSDVEYLVDSMWNDAFAYANEQNYLVEEAYMERENSLLDIMAGRW